VPAATFDQAERDSIQKKSTGQYIQIPGNNPSAQARKPKRSQKSKLEAYMAQQKKNPRQQIIPLSGKKSCRLVMGQPIGLQQSSFLTNSDAFTQMLVISMATMLRGLRYITPPYT
jgi:hypothetical protein